MAKHHPDLIFCRKQAGKLQQQNHATKSATKLLGVAIGRLCDKCDGRCVICDSYVRPSTLVRICDECNYGSFQVRESPIFCYKSNVFRDDVLFVEVQVFPMHTTVKSVQS